MFIKGNNYLQCMKLNGVDINTIKFVVHDSIPEKYGKMDPTSITKSYEDEGESLGKSVKIKRDITRKVRLVPKKNQ